MVYWLENGQVAEWLKAHVPSACMRATASGVRIPSLSAIPPPFLALLVPVVAWLVEALDVVFVPEEKLVAMVRDLVISDKLRARRFVTARISDARRQRSDARSEVPHVRRTPDAAWLIPERRFR